MRSITLFRLALASACLALVPTARSVEPDKVINLWPNATSAPAEQERDMTKPNDGLVARKPVIRLGHVSKPTISIYSPTKAANTGAAVLVCPGGGYSILAMDLEGTEVCEWLNSIGVTGVLLKYRVPKPAGADKNPASLEDAQRALGVLRHQAKEYGIDQEKIGVLGFSAGGHLAAALSNNYEQRKYPPIDEADAISCRPNFAVLIYPAYLTLKAENDKIAPDLNITSNTPPTFLAMAQDDPVRVETALFYALALKNAKVPTELHIYPSGGHGYGLRPSTNLVTTWPARAEEWMRARAILPPKPAQSHP